MNHKAILAALAASVATATFTLFAQTLTWSDNFDDNYPNGWVKGFYGEMAENNHQFRIGGSFGPTPISQPTET
jgi:hypothetical protein